MMRKLVQNDGLSSLYLALSLVAAVGLVIPATTVDCEQGGVQQLVASKLN